MKKRYRKRKALYKIESTKLINQNSLIEEVKYGKM
jgi:hypothetical protein